MFFGDLRDALLDYVRARVRNGQLTERGLARLTGISQPHMHNVLKGVRSMSPDTGDRILFHLRLSALDLVDPQILGRHLQVDHSDNLAHSYLPLLSGRIGPGHPWPTTISSYERFPVPQSVVARMFHPVVVHVADDLRMYPLFSDGDLLLLDQARQARTRISDDALYVIKRGRVGLIRRLRETESGMFVVDDDAAVGERLPVEQHHITHFVRARGVFITRDTEWC